VDSCKNIWMQSFLLSWRSSLSSCAAALNSLLLEGVCTRRHSPWSVLFFFFQFVA
jgi:hypothetical protein